MSETMIFARISANSGGISRDGVIEKSGTRFRIIVDGIVQAQAGSLDSAAHRLAAALREALPWPAPDWGVSAACTLRADVGLVFGNLVTGGGSRSGVPNPCVARVLHEYNKGENHLHRALTFAARLVTSCCS